MKFIVLALSLSAALLSCKSSITSGVSDDVVSIQLSKSGSAPVAGTVFTEGKTVGFYMDQTDGTTATPYKVNIQGLTEVNGGLLFNPAVPYPSNNNLNIYGYYPYNQIEAVASVIEVPTVVDQSTDAAYEEMDFLVARELNKAREKTTFALPFYHKHSQITIELKPGVGFSSLDQLNKAIVTLSEVPSKSGYNYINDVMTADFGSLVTVKPYGSLVQNQAGNALEGLTALLPVRSANDAPYVAMIDIDGVLYPVALTGALESGKSYKYTLTINRSGVVPLMSIQPWEAGASADYPAYLWAKSQFKFTLETGIAKTIGAVAKFTMSSEDGVSSRVSSVTNSNDVFEIVTPLECPVLTSAVFTDDVNGDFTVEFSGVKISPVMQEITITSSMIK